MILYILFSKCTSLFPLYKTLKLFELALLISRHLNIILLYMYIHLEISYCIASFRNLYFERISRISRIVGGKKPCKPFTRFLVNILFISYISCAHYVCTIIHTIYLNHLKVVCMSFFIHKHFDVHFLNNKDFLLHSNSIFINWRKRNINTKLLSNPMVPKLCTGCPTAVNSWRVSV